MLVMIPNLVQTVTKMIMMLEVPPLNIYEELTRYYTLNIWMIYMDTVGLIWFGRFIRLPPRYTNDFLKVLVKREKIATVMVSSEEDKMLSMQSSEKMSSFLFILLPLLFLFYSQPPPCIALLFQLWGIFSAINYIFSLI